MPKEVIRGDDGLHVMIAWDKHDNRLAQMASFNEDEDESLTPGPDNGWFVNLTADRTDRIIKILKKVRKSL